MTEPYDPSKLAETVAEMRRLGVTRFGDIVLGPDPTQQPDDATQRTAEADRVKQERDKRLRFGASGGPRPRAAIK